MMIPDSIEVDYARNIVKIAESSVFRVGLQINGKNDEEYIMSTHLDVLRFV